MGQQMNRQMKRMAKKMGQVDDEGQPINAAARQDRARKARSPRVGPIRFLKEVAAELRKVKWPTRAEVLNYSWVTLGAVVFIGALIFALDSAFVHGAGFLFK